MLDVAVGRYDAGTGVAPVRRCRSRSWRRSRSTARCGPIRSASHAARRRRRRSRAAAVPVARGRRASRSSRAAPSTASSCRSTNARCGRCPATASCRPNRVHLVEPAGRAVRRGPARPHLRGSGEARDRPGRRGTRRRRPARRVLPAGARNHGGDGDDGGSARLLDDRGGADVGAAACARCAYADRARDVRLPRLRGARAPKEQPAVGARGASAAQPPIPAPIVPQPGPAPNPAPAPQPLPQTAPPVPPPPPRTRGARAARRAAARRPGAPARRAGRQPPAPAAPPALPSGLSVQSAPATQVQAFQATQVQQQRRRAQASRPTAPPWPTRTRLRRCRGSCSAAARCSRWRSRAER